MEKQQLNQTKTTIASQQAKTTTKTLPTTHPILQLQADIGNRAVNQLLEAHSQLASDKPSHYSLTSRFSGMIPSSQSPIQAKEPFRGLSHELIGELDKQGEVLPLAKSGGKTMPEPVQQKMETAFSTDFSDVRIHEGKEAESIGAIAYTRGRDIHFAPGKYDPISQTGQQLLGHELTHVVQQQSGQVTAPQGLGMPINADRKLEAEADTLGAKAVQGEPAQVAGAGGHYSTAGAAGAVVQCGKLKKPREWLGRNLGIGLGKSGRTAARERRVAQQAAPNLIDSSNQNPKSESENFRYDLRYLYDKFDEDYDAIHEAEYDEVGDELSAVLEAKENELIAKRASEFKGFAH